MASTTGGGQSSAETGVGKRSLVDQTFGAPSGIGAKRQREDSEGGEGGEGGEDGGRGDKRLRDDGFAYAIDDRSAGSFSHDHSPAVANAVQGPPATGQQANGPAYVGNIITVARGKDKSPVQVAAQYRDEAFDDPQQAAQRFALVVGVNRMESVAEPAESQQAPLDQEIAQVAGFQQFPLAAFRRLWRPVWRHTDGENAGQPANFDEVRAAATRHQGAARAEEGRGKRQAPVGPMRTATTQHELTARYTQLLQQRFANVFIHVGDADAVNLKAKATADAAAPRGLFDRYDQVIGDAHAAGKQPTLISGGYRFRVDNRYLPEDQQHADPHAGQAGRVAPQTAASADLDMQARQGLASVDPSKVYMPEPNLLIRADAAGQADFGQTNKDESKRLAESLNGGAAPDKAWGTQNMLFDTRAALYTDGGRFNEAMTQNFSSGAGTTGDQYAAGATDVEGLFHPKRNLQSVARKRDLGNAIARMNGNIGDILDLYLPQQLMKLSEQRQRGGIQQSTLDVVRDYLRTYAVIVGGIEQALTAAVQDPAIKIPAKTKNSKVSGPMQATATQRVRPNIADLDEFSDTALGSPEALSEALVKAISAAKAFNKEVGQLPEILAQCKAAAIATASFLATFFPQAAQEQRAPGPDAQPPQAVSSSSTQPRSSVPGPLSPGPMDIDEDSPRPGGDLA